MTAINWASVRIGTKREEFLLLIVRWEPGLALLLVPRLPAGLDHGRNIREEESSTKDEASAQPVVRSEGIVEVHDGEEETEELPQSDDQSDGKAGTLRGEHKHGGDADVLSDHVPQQVEQHDG